MLNTLYILTTYNYVILDLHLKINYMYLIYRKVMRKNNLFLCVKYVAYYIPRHYIPRPVNGKER